VFLASSSAHTPKFGYLNGPLCTPTIPIVLVLYLSKA